MHIPHSSAYPKHVVTNVVLLWSTIAKYGCECYVTYVTHHVRAVSKSQFGADFEATVRP